jgi:hypothetical protein
VVPDVTVSGQQVTDATQYMVCNMSGIEEDVSVVQPTILDFSVLLELAHSSICIFSSLLFIRGDARQGDQEER